MPPTKKELLDKAKKIRKQARDLEKAAAGEKLASGYEEHRDKMAEKSAARALAGREIGPIPGIADPERRDRCSRDLELFDRTYNPEAFFLPFCDDHRSEIKRVEEAVFHGALYAFAEPRGSGKTTRCRMAALWAASYAHSRYVFVIGANDDKALDTLQAIKTFMRFLPLYAADFPEVALAVQALGGIPHRAMGQVCGGRSTMIEWASDRVVLPTVPAPTNWPKHWPLRGDGMVPTSGSIIGVSGLTGEGIRGSVKTLTTGEQVRPDLILIDDPQTGESSGSKLQNATRYKLISADVLNMAGPGKRISCVMPCTVITRGDMIDRILDRTRHPLWRGERTRLLRSLPSNMDAWDGYFEVYKAGVVQEPPDLAEANAYYLANRDKLDEGAEASWAERKHADEVSAIQHAMHLYCRDRSAFFSEYQNDPLEEMEPGQLPNLHADSIAAKLTGADKGEVAPEYTRVTAFVDVGGKVLFWCVVGWAEGFKSGSVLDYGAYPRQNRPYFAAEDARPSLAELPGLENADETARVYHGLRTITDALLTRDWPRHGGGSARIEVCLVDAGWNTDTVHQFCRQSPHAGLLRASMGYGIGASQNPIAAWAKKEGERRGAGWVLRPNTESGKGRTLLFDANHFKSFIAQRLLTPMGGHGCLALFGKRAEEHRLFADHLTAEYRIETFGRGRKVEEWKIRPERPDNHWWDCLVGCAVGASLLGLVWSPNAVPEVRPVPKLRSMKEMYEAAQKPREVPK